MCSSFALLFPRIDLETWYWLWLIRPSSQFKVKSLCNFGKTLPKIWGWLLPMLKSTYINNQNAALCPATLGQDNILTSSIHPHTQPVKLVVACGILPKTKEQFGCCARSVSAWLTNIVFVFFQIPYLFHLRLYVEFWKQFFYYCFVCIPVLARQEWFLAGSHFILSICETGILKGSESRRIVCFTL